MQAWRGHRVDRGATGQNEAAWYSVAFAARESFQLMVMVYTR
jgi:hypothetical protein